MTQEEFIAGYCERSGITREFFLAHGDAVPCDCGQDSCAGWRYETQPDRADLFIPHAEEPEAPPGGQFFISPGGMRHLDVHGHTGTTNADPQHAAYVSEVGSTGQDVPATLAALAFFEPQVGNGGVTVAPETDVGCAQDAGWPLAPGDLVICAAGPRPRALVEHGRPGQRVELGLLGLLEARAAVEHHWIRSEREHAPHREAGTPGRGASRREGAGEGSVGQEDEGGAMTPREALALDLAPRGEYQSHTFYECPLCGWLRWSCSLNGKPEGDVKLIFEPIDEWEYQAGRGCVRCLEVYARAPELVAWVTEVTGKLALRIGKLAGRIEELEKPEGEK